MAGRGLSSLHSELSGYLRTRELPAEELHGEHLDVVNRGGFYPMRTMWTLASLGLYACTVLFLSSVLADAGRPEQATAFLESLELEASRVDRLPIQTSREIRRLLAQSQFDCTRISCEPDLRTRNLVVRTRLESRLTGEARQFATK